MDAIHEGPGRHCRMTEDQPIIVYFDLETTGRDPQRHEIIQIAAVATHGEEILAEFEVKLQFDIQAAEPEALELNSYDAEVWAADARPPRVGLKMFSDFMSEHASIKNISKRTGREYSTAKLAGHNAADFDMPFLARAFKMNGMFLPSHWRVLDTLALADWLQIHGMINPPSLKLVDLCEYFEVRLTDAHDALADVRATAAVGNKMLRLIRGEAPFQPSLF